jgi:glutamate-1-semialdehyde 2,1-aminomutase/spore coat polysaccharide biosynthesis protein SpsF
MTKVQSSRYQLTHSLLKRAKKVIPLGTQTFSKSFQQYPDGAAPLFLTHGQGCRVWDVDGNEFVDMVAGLLPVLLGYCDPDVDTAIRDQLEHGISFSLATELEVEVAELLTEIIPCAEMVRFGKNGSDATTGCVRVARAATGRDRILICGYHGWHDWYVAATVRNKGIPDVLSQLAQRVPYNDLDAVQKAFRANPGEIAALVIEPMSAISPDDGYLAELKSLVHSEGALLVFDEIITGFRFALGGAQEYFGVTPDLAAFGKAMGNGMPISAVVGRANLMMEMEEVFFSSTFGGEALSLAAAKSVIRKLQGNPVIESLWTNGGLLAKRVRQLIVTHGLSDSVSLKGAAPWTILAFQDTPTASKESIKTMFMKEMLANGVLIAASNNMTYAHQSEDVAQVVAAYNNVFELLKEHLRRGDLEKALGCAPIMPVFSVRNS